MPRFFTSVISIFSPIFRYRVLCFFPNSLTRGRHWRIRANIVPVHTKHVQKTWLLKILRILKLCFLTDLRLLYIFIFCFRKCKSSFLWTKQFYICVRKHDIKFENSNFSSRIIFRFIKGDFSRFARTGTVQNVRAGSIRPSTPASPPALRGGPQTTARRSRGY